MSNPRAIAKTSATSITNAIPTAIKCSYRSKPCNSVRATKLNGDFHKLCEYHRRRANLNQQRVHQRRKLREYGEKKQQTHSQQQKPYSHQHFDRSSVSSPSSVGTSSFSWMAFTTTSNEFFPVNYDTEDLLSDSDLDLDFELECEPSLRPCGDLPLPDLKLLELLLSDNTCEVSPTVYSSQPESRLEFLNLALLEA